jgi:spermidine/putrescine transport system permease protein
VSATRILETAGAWLLALLWILPLAYAVWTAFHSAEYSARFVPTAPLTLENFANAWKAAPFARYFLNTFMLVTLILAAQLVLCTLAAYAFARFEFRSKRLLQLLLFPPITIPWLIIGTSMLIFFFWTGIGRGLHAILLGHVALSLPYVIVVVGARFASFGPQLEEAAATLGATPVQVFLRVTIPVLAPGIVAAALFAFAVSFDQFVISYFLAPPGTSTLPVEIYTAIRKGFTPEINAISSIIILVSMALMLGVARLYKFGGDT